MSEAPSYERDAIFKKLRAKTENKVRGIQHGHCRTDKPGRGTAKHLGV